MLGRTLPGGPFSLPNVPMHALAQGHDKRLHLRRATLDTLFDPAVREVPYPTRHLELARHLQRRKAEAHALDVTGKKDGFVVHWVHDRRASWRRAGNKINRNHITFNCRNGAGVFALRFWVARLRSPLRSPTVPTNEQFRIRRPF